MPHNPIVRWLIRSDLETVVEIDRLCAVSGQSWNKEKFYNTLRLSNCIGVVIEDVDHVTRGFMIYGLEDESLDILRIGVCSARQSRGFGSAMLNRLKEKLSHGRRIVLEAHVDYRNLPLLEFLKRRDFWAEGCSDTEGGTMVIHMRHRLPIHSHQHTGEAGS